MILLVHLLKEVLRKNAIKSPVVKKKTKEMYENGLSEDDRARIKEFMFTSKNMELNSSQERFLQSTIDLGFPEAGTFRRLFPRKSFIPCTSTHSSRRIPQTTANTSISYEHNRSSRICQTCPPNQHRNASRRRFSSYQSRHVPG